jgi:Domain of unknown function (DUF4157)
MLIRVDHGLEHAIESTRAAPASRRDAGPDPAALSSALGNRTFTQLVARMHDGEGILSGGVVHPEVEAAIAAAQGSGTPLESTLARRLSDSYGEPLHDVRVHTDSGAAALARAVSARAFTVGSDIFFGSGEYAPATPGGGELIAHETAHVVQQRGAPASGPLTVSQPGDALEREAEAMADGLIG